MDNPIVIRGVSMYEGWIGVIYGMVHSSNAQGDVFSVSIAPDADSPLTEVYLPASAIKVLSPTADHAQEEDQCLN